MSKPGNDSIAYSGFVIPETGELIVNKPGWFIMRLSSNRSGIFCETDHVPMGRNTA
jgi:hypothetical protein